MKRFFCPAQDIKKDKARITDKTQIHHLVNVLRLKVGDPILLFDGSGEDYICKIESIDKDCMNMNVEKRSIKKSNVGSITLACALTRRSKFDYIVEKTTELGASKIIPVITERSIVKIDEKDIVSKTEHWQRIAFNASQQSRQDTITQVLPPADFNTSITLAKDYDLALFATLENGSKTLFELLKNKKNFQNVIIFIGPEGDFSKQEVELAKKNGCSIVKLLNTILKVDTACIYSIGMISTFLSR